MVASSFVGNTNLGQLLCSQTAREGRNRQGSICTPGKHFF